MKTAAYIIIPIAMFFAGLWTATVLTSNNSIEESEVGKAISNIYIYTNKIYTEYEHIVVDHKMVNQFSQSDKIIIDKYNSLLTDSRAVVKDFAILQKDYDRLNKLNNRKLFFLLGISAQYSFKRNIADAGLMAGIEYKKFGVLGGYMFINQTITVSAYYRF